MVQTGKLAVISILAVLGLGALGGGFYVGDTIIPDAIDEGIKDSLVVDQSFKKDDPTGYADWLTNENVTGEDDRDAPKYKRYYFWNLTNSDEYLTGSKPVFEEIGPYVYRQFDVKKNVAITSTTKKYQTYTYFVFDSALSDGGAETDIIINVNPAYLGVLAGAGSEAALVTGFVGPTIAGILDGLLTTFTDGTVATGISTAIAGIMDSLSGDFVDNVKVQGTSIMLNTTLDGLLGEFPETVLTQAVALGLLDIQAAMTESFHTAVNATTAANVMFANWLTAKTLNGTDIANRDFFNSTNFFDTYNSSVVGAPGIQGLGEFTGTLAYTNASITKLLWDGPDAIAPGLGWFTDFVSGTGVLGFLQLYENATLEVGGLTRAILSNAYNLTEGQLDAAATYLLTYLIADNPAIEGAYRAGNAGQTTLEAAQALFQGQWANATSLPGGADINSDGNTPDGFEVGLPVDSDLSSLAVTTLFDPSNPLSLTNSTQGIFAWVGAANGNATLEGLLAGTYTGLINATQLAMILAWVGNFRDFTIQAGLLAKFAQLGVIELKDLGYVHWGSGVVTSGLSLFDLDPTLGAYPEPWAWASNVASTTFTLNMSNSENLLTGPTNLTDAVGVGTFLLLGQQAVGGNATALGALNAVFQIQLNTTHIGLLLTYIDYLMNTFVIGELPVSSYDDLAAFQWGDSTVTEGLSVNHITPVGFWPELWAYVEQVMNGSLTLNLATSLALTTGLKTPEGVGAFLVYGLSAAGGNATALAIINGAFSGTTLTGAEALMITSYLGYLLDTLVLPTFGGITKDDIGYAHWGSSIITGGISLNLLAPDLGLPNVPEFWAWASFVAGSPMNLTLEQSKALLTGDNSLLNSTTVGMMLIAAPGLLAGDPATIGVFDSILGETFSTSEYTMLIGYIQYMMQVYVAGWVLGPVIAAGGGLIATKTVVQWLWEYDDPLLLFLKENGQVDDAEWAFFPPHDNATDPAIDVAHTFKTGADDINNVQQYVLWQGLSEIPSRDTDPENGSWDHIEKVVGTDATQFHPNVESSETLKAWVSEIMRSVELVYLEDTKTEGIDLLRFILADNVLAVNSAFDQTVKGIANMTYTAGVPLFVSKPHFLDADPSARTVDGLAPTKADHELFVDIEPTTGAVMNAAKRLQISFLISAGNFLTLGIAETHYMPVIWIEEGGAITPGLADKFKDAIYGAQQFEEIAPIAGVAIGAVLLLTSMFIGIRARKP